MDMMRSRRRLAECYIECFINACRQLFAVSLCRLIAIEWHIQVGKYTMYVHTCLLAWNTKAIILQIISLLIFTKLCTRLSVFETPCTWFVTMYTVRHMKDHNGVWTNDPFGKFSMGHSLTPKDSPGGDVSKKKIKNLRALSWRHDPHKTMQEPGLSTSMFNRL